MSSISPRSELGRLPLVALGFFAVAAALGVTTVHQLLLETDGEPAAALDDAYIHFQFARSLADFQPFVYSPGDVPVAGATSLLWPLLLCPFFWAGVGGADIVVVAWGLSFLFLGLLAHDTYRAAYGLLSRTASVSSGLMVLAFGGMVWTAGSGMEGALFAWLLMRSAWAAADFAECAPKGRSRKRWQLLASCAACALARPEGVLVASAVSALFLARERGWQRAYALTALLVAALPALLTYLFTGQASSTTSNVKWLPLNPYYDATDLVAAVWRNLRLLFLTLFNGEVWSASVLPKGGRYLAWLAPIALLLRARSTGKRWRGGAVGLVAALLLLTTSYDTFLWNRLRYLWPFMPAWFIGLAAVFDLARDLIPPKNHRFVPLVYVPLAGVIGALASCLPASVTDLAKSSNGIRQQQVSLGRWAHDHLPPKALIGVNDTGAIAYFSERRTFDIVGLTTASEGTHWVAGAGSRFEHYERVGESQLPSHFIVYPEWFALDPLLGEELTSRDVFASILGGTHMGAYVADYSGLGTGARPERPSSGAPLDSLDVADLVSEAEHDYQLFDARQADNKLEITFDDRNQRRLDGARDRRQRERFKLRMRPGGTLVARVGATRALSLRLRADGKELGTLALRPAPWQELSLRLPQRIPSGVVDVEILATEQGSGFAALHYWSFAE